MIITVTGEDFMTVNVTVQPGAVINVYVTEPIPNELLDKLQASIDDLDAFLPDPAPQPPTVPTT